MKKKLQVFAVLTSNCLEIIGFIFSATLSMIFHGMTFAWPSPSLPKLLSPDSPTRITNSDGSWLAIIHMPASFIGDPLSAYLANKYGRKTIILLCSIPLIITGIIIGYDTSFESLMIARFVAGLGGSGLFTVVPTYIAEVTEPKIRGKLGAMLIWMWDFGMLLMYVIGPFVTIETMGFISISVPVISIITFVWMPESPYYFMLKRNREEATKILKMLREEDNVDRIIDEIEEELLITTSFSDVFKYPLNRKTLFILSILMTVQESSGRLPFLFYSQTIFLEADKSLPAIYISMFYAFLQLIVAFSGSFIIDQFKRKTLLVVSCTGSTICLIVVGLYFFFKYYFHYNMQIIKWLPACTFIIFIIIFQVGLGIVPMTMAGEVFATNVKTSGLCFLDLYTAIIAMVISKFFQLTSDYIGIYFPFLTFACISLLGIVFIIKCLPETKGLSLEEIQKNLKRENVRDN